MSNQDILNIINIAVNIAIIKKRKNLLVKIVQQATREYYKDNNNKDNIDMRCVVICTNYNKPYNK